MQALSTKYEMGVSIDQVQLKSINPLATVQVSKGFVVVVNLASLRRGRELLELFYIPRGDRN